MVENLEIRKKVTELRPDHSGEKNAQGVLRDLWIITFRYDVGFCHLK